jgi:hypothetical protein
MSTIIKIKRSSTTNQPSLAQGEMGYSWGTGTYSDSAGGTVTSYGKLYLGTGTETNGVSANLEVIGGKYFTDLLDHTHGQLAANSALITDSSSKLNVINIDNLTLDGNTLSSTNADGHIVFDPAGTGEVKVVDDTYLSFGSDSDAKIKYDEASTDTVKVEGADWEYTNGVSVVISDSTASTDSTTGALTVAGGVGIAGDLYVAGGFAVGTAGTPTDLNVSGDLSVNGGDVNFTSTATNINLRDNTVGALDIQQGSDSYLKIDTTDTSEHITLGNSLNSTEVIVKDNNATAFVLKESTNNYFAVSTTNASEKITLGNTLASTEISVVDNKQSAFSVKEGSNLYIDVNTSDGAEKITYGNSLSIHELNIRDNVSSSVVVKEGTNEYLSINTTDSAEKIKLGNNLSKTEFEVLDNSTDAFRVYFGDTDNSNTPETVFKIDTSQGTVLTTLSSGNVQIDNDLNIDGGDLTSTLTTFNLFNTTVSTLNIAGGANTISIGSSAGTTTVNNNLDVGGDVEFGGTIINSTSASISAFDSPSTVTAFASATSLSIGSASTTTDFGDILIKGNTIYSESNAGTIVIDPYPIAGDQGGDVVVRGNFTVTGTTTTVDSTVMTINDPVISIGDATSTATTTTASPPAGQVLGFDNETGLAAPSPNDRTDGSYQIVASGGSGTGATFTVTVDVNGDATVVLDNGGANYLNDETLTLAASGNFGGATDITVDVNGVTTSSTNGVLTIDSVDGLNVGDSVTGHSNIQAGSTISSIDQGNSKITLNQPLSGIVPAEIELTIVRGGDDNMDRGVRFNYYNNGSKLGFFGYDETAVSEGVDTTYYFTYIPDAAESGNVFSGTVGSAYFNTTKLEIGIQNGVPYFDAYKRLTTTVAAGTSDATTSNQLLTVDSNGVPVWTTTLDGGSY